MEKKLNQYFGRKVIGIGCEAHIIYNAIKTATDCFPVEFESIIRKNYSFLHIYSVSVEAFNEFCNALDTEYQKLLG